MWQSERVYDESLILHVQAGTCERLAGSQRGGIRDFFDRRGGSRAMTTLRRRQSRRAGKGSQPELDDCRIR
jgi:hypothetical protein